LLQGAFAGVTAVIAVGGAAERMRVIPLLIFIFCWTSIVYNAIAHWVWASNGWLYALGASSSSFPSSSRTFSS